MNQIFLGCPNCGELKYRTQFPMYNQFGKQLFDMHGNPKTQAMFNKEDDSCLEWKRQMYICAKCGKVYDRREGISKKFGGLRDGI